MQHVGARVTRTCRHGFPQQGNVNMHRLCALHHTAWAHTCRRARARTSRRTSASCVTCSLSLMPDGHKNTNHSCHWLISCTRCPYPIVRKLQKHETCQTQYEKHVVRWPGMRVLLQRLSRVVLDASFGHQVQTLSSPVSLVCRQGQTIPPRLGLAVASALVAL